MLLTCPTINICETFNSTCPGGPRHKPKWGFERISTVTIMYLLYSVNVYSIFNVVIEIKLYSTLFYYILAKKEILTLEVTTGPNSARAISADRAHGRNSAQFGMTL